MPSSDGYQSDDLSDEDREQLVHEATKTLAEARQELSKLREALERM